jgi:hypothetical protein
MKVWDSRQKIKQAVMLKVNINKSPVRDDLFIEKTQY